MWLSLARSPGAHCGMRCSGIGLAHGPAPEPEPAPVTCHSVRETPAKLRASAWAQAAPQGRAECTASAAHIRACNPAAQPAAAARMSAPTGELFDK